MTSECSYKNFKNGKILHGFIWKNVLKVVLFDFLWDQNFEEKHWRPPEQKLILVHIDVALFTSLTLDNVFEVCTSHRESTCGTMFPIFNRHKGGVLVMEMIVVFFLYDFKLLCYEFASIRDKKLAKDQGSMFSKFSHSLCKSIQNIIFQTSSPFILMCDTEIDMSTLTALAELPKSNTKLLMVTKRAGRTNKNYNMICSL